MCFWGEALVLGPNINMPMMPEAVPAAFTAMSKATALGKTDSAREQALIAALAKRYTNDAKVDRKPLDEAYAAAEVRDGTFPSAEHTYKISNEEYDLFASETRSEVIAGDDWI